MIRSDLRRGIAREAPAGDRIVRPEHQLVPRPSEVEQSVPLRGGSGWGAAEMAALQAYPQRLRPRIPFAALPLAPAISSALPAFRGTAQLRRELVVAGAAIDAAAGAAAAARRVVGAGVGGRRFVRAVRRSLLILGIAGLLLGLLPHLRRTKDGRNQLRNRLTFNCSIRTRNSVYRAAADVGRGPPAAQRWLVVVGGGGLMVEEGGVVGAGKTAC